jgi:hypothetical protein
MLDAYWLPFIFSTRHFGEDQPSGHVAAKKREAFVILGEIYRVSFVRIALNAAPTGWRTA